MPKEIKLTENQKKNLISLKKISSSSLKIAKMIEEGATCYDVLQQLKAVAGLLKGVQNRAMECSLEEFLEDSDNFSAKEKYKKLEEITKSIELFNK